MARKTVVIAEIGENHLGDMERAKEMIRAAKTAGADIAKFQSYRAADIPEKDPEKEWFGKVQVSDADHKELMAECKKVGIEFLSAPFTVERARLLVETLGLKKLKIASSEMLNGPLLDYAAKHCKTVILSTGLAALDEVSEAVERLHQVPELYVLQCTTQYPCPPEEANLAVLGAFKKRFPNRKVGFSDHTLGIDAAVLAVAAGADLIEKHFTLDKSLPGTDHVLSATPAELEEMIQRIERAEVLLGSADKRPTENEKKIIEFVRTRFPKNG